jgi:uncharacterized phage protein (TIGR01671 family)
MREIKFRAWVRNQKTMLPVIGIRDIGNGSGIIELRMLDVTYVSTIYLGEYEVELMQFIGLKDNNGKEIYEGDIVRESDPYEEISVVGPVKYSYGSFYIENDFEHNSWEGTTDIEVVGNIYENPELMVQME